MAGRRGAKKWAETEEQAAWRRSMDPNSRHQRLSALSTATVGDARAISQLEAAAQYELRVQQQVAEIKQGGGDADPMSDVGGGMPVNEDAVLEIASAALLARLEASFPARTSEKRALLVPPSTPPLPSSAPNAESGPLGNHLEAQASQTVDPLRQLFSYLDKDGDGKVGAKDLALQYTAYGQPLSRKLIREIIFEVDDDGDGALGWQDFSNLWMRTKKSLRSNDADQPMRLFNLIDFACVDLATHEDGAVGRIPNNKMLELFDRRYGNLAALELMDETSIGDTALGVTFESYAARATKLHEALFYADMLHQGPETGGNDVSRKTKKGYKSGYSKTKREIEQGKIRDVGQFIALAQGRAGIQPHSRPASDSELQALAPKARGRRKKAMGEFCKWTAMPREQQAMLEMFCRKGDVRELLLFVTPVLSKFSNFKSRATLMIELSELLIKEMRQDIRKDELDQLHEMVELVRKSKRV